MENNRLIAEFMGLTKYGEHEYLVNFNIYHKDNLQYYTSWDWLMPVVEKISDNKFTNSCWITDEGVRISFSGNARSEINAYYVDFKSRIEAVYNAVIEFINWYNTQKL